MSDHSPHGSPAKCPVCDKDMVKVLGRDVCINKECPNMPLRTHNPTPKEIEKWIEDTLDTPLHLQPVNPLYGKLHGLLYQKYIDEEVDLGGDPVWIDELMDTIWPEIQDLLVQAWHADNLHEALGMTEDQYTRWVETHE